MNRINRRAGFTLIELLVAVVLLSVVMAGLVPVTFKVALQGRHATTLAQRSATVTAELEYQASRDFSALSAGTSCTNNAGAAFSHSKCVTIAAINSNRKRITVIVSPLTGAGIGPDTAVVDRSLGKAGNPLNTP